MSSKESLPSDNGEESGDWSTHSVYTISSKGPVHTRESESDYWWGWHLGVCLGFTVLVVGAITRSLSLLVIGYLLTPVTIYLDAHYLESITPGWKPDLGLYVLGSILFPLLLVPYYLYRRRELRR